MSPVLFNCFVDELAKELKATGCGVSVGEKLIHSLLYADDVVLLAETEQDLQELIDVVDKFCRKWRMTINLRKIEAMVVGNDRECPFCRVSGRSVGCCPRACTPWTCRDATAKVVPSYKYLGIWFNEKLTWTTHFNKMMKKAGEKASYLRLMIRNKRIPVRAKLLVWLAYVRPTLEYGGEVWTPNANQDRKMESLQTQAGVRICRLNEKTSRHAVRALMHVPRIGLRRLQARLKYFAKLKTMVPERITRYVVEYPEERAVGTGNGRQHQWKHRVWAAIQDDEDLWRAWTRVRQSLQRNGNVLPDGLDLTWPDLDGKHRYKPVATWKRNVERWAATRNMDETLDAAEGENSTLKIIARACRNRLVVPRFTVTKYPNRGPDQIRLRLICGTNSLNATQSRVRRGTPRSCPDKNCNGADEDAAHFLLDCRLTESLRTTYREDLQTCCTCEPEEGYEDDFQTCGEYFETLGREGKVLFILGGPLSGRTPERKVDAASRRFVEEAHKRRVKLVNSQSKNPLSVDLTRQSATEVSNGPVSVPLDRFFSVARREHSTTGPPRNRNQDQNTRARYTQHVCTSKPLGREGSGVHGLQAGANN